MLVPYLVWSILYLIKDYVLTGGNISYRRIIYSLCCGKAATPLYYIVVLIQLTLLTPWLAIFKNRRWMYVITPIYLVFLYIYNMYTGQMPRLYETLFPAWFLFYIMGMDCRIGKWDNIISRIKAWFVPIAILLSVIEALLLLNAGCEVGFASSQIKFSSFIYAMVIASVAMRRKDCAKQNTGKIQRLLVSFFERLLASVGDCSYGIFYVHMLVLMVARKAETIVGLSEIWIVNFLLCFVLTACGSFAIVFGVRKIAERVGAEKYLKIIGF